jgi:thiamine-monophosphate kinase
LAHRRPLVDYFAARDFALAGVSAMCDVSDGLVSELSHIARASGVGIEIRTDEPIDFHGGEDHIFVATISPHLPFPRQAIEIGRVVLGKGVRVNGEMVSHQGFNALPE